MHTLVSFNYRVCSAADARLSAVSASVLYGKGVFTTLAIHGGKPFLWEKHWARVADNAGRVGIDIADFSEQTVVSALAGLIEQNRVAEGLARVTFFDESGGGAWPSETGKQTGLLIMTGETRVVPEQLKLTISPYRVNSASPLAGVKSCNYLENLLALEEAKAGGFDEAVRVNERNQVAGGCMANIFWRKDGRLFTPALESGCLAGTTRAHVIEKLGAFETEGSLDVLARADAIFLTSAGLGMVQAAEFAGLKFETEVYDIMNLAA